METNKIVPIESKNRICVHCDDEYKTTYLIAEPQQGKTSETVRQAVFRRNIILSEDYSYFKSLGMKHAKDTKDGEIGYMGIRDLLYKEHDYFADKPALHLSVDGAKGILEKVLSEMFKTKVIIEFMAIEAPLKNE